MAVQHDPHAARRLTLCGSWPPAAAIVAKNEFIEIRVDVLAAQAVICAEAPSFHQRESAMDPRQDNVARGSLALGTHRLI